MKPTPTEHKNVFLDELQEGDIFIEGNKPEKFWVRAVKVKKFCGRKGPNSKRFKSVILALTSLERNKRDYWIMDDPDMKVVTIGKMA